jgi:hypothetical protein
MEKGSILPPIFSPYVNQALETGWPQHWLNLITLKRKITGVCDTKLEREEIKKLNQRVHIHNEESQNMLKLEQLLSLKYIFIFNIILFFLIFVLELTFQKVVVSIRNYYKKLEMENGGLTTTYLP